MSLTCLVGRFTSASSTGAQTVTLTSGTFTPKAGLFWSGDQITTSGQMHYNRGFDDATTHLGTATNAGDFLGTYDGTESAGSDSYSLLVVRNSAAFQITALGYVSAWGTGSFTVQWDQNDSLAHGKLWNYLLFGGSGVNVHVGKIAPPTMASSVTYNLSCADPVAILTGFHPFVESSTGNGGGIAGPVGLGFATACGSKQFAGSCADDDLANPSNSAGGQQATAAFYVADTSAVTLRGAITAWSSTGITVNWTVPSAGGVYFAYLALGGTLAANSGILTQPTSTGAQRYTYTVADPKAVLVMSAMRVANAAQTANLKWALGAGDVGLHQYCTFAGDVDNKAPAAWADGSQTTTLLIATTPTGPGASSVNAEASLVDLSQGSMGWNWTTADSTLRESYYLVFGADTQDLPCGGAAPPTITTYATRRERVFSLPFDMNLWVFLQRLEILVQSGVGLSTGQGSDPKLMLSISRDGGHTYGNEMQLGVGKMGEYLARAFANRLGRGRNLVCKVACSDPVFCALLACFIDAEAGTS